MIFIGTFLLLLQHLFLSSAFAVSGSRHHRNHSLLADEAALLAFRKTIVSDPKSRLAGWTEGGDVCSFKGVRCDKHRHSGLQLNLSRSELTGALSPIISNLSGLRYLILDENHFYGIIPPEFSSLRPLHSLRLDSNNLRGSFPGFLAALPNLTVLTLSENHLMGTIPPSLFSNCTSLANIELSPNLLTGKIPQEIGNCPSLWNLNLYNNQFTGELPASLANISELYNIDVEYNSLTRELPANTVGKLYSIVSLHFSYNKMTNHDHSTNFEPFFTALANCTESQNASITSH